MRCPFCAHLDSKVVDSRVSKNAAVIRRRRECLECGQRYTTYERVEEIETYVIKKNGTRLLYDRERVKKGLMTALNKRAVSVELVEEFLDELETKFQEQSRREIPTREIGEAVLRKLKDLDEVAFVRFASVYRDFKDMDDFKRALDELANGGSLRPNETT